MIDWRKELNRHAPARVVAAVEAALERQRQRHRGEQQPAGHQQRQKHQQQQQKQEENGEEKEEEVKEAIPARTKEAIALTSAAREGFAAFAASLASFE